MFKRLIRFIERPLVYFPERALKGTPDHVGLEFEDVWLTTADGVRINAWWIPGPGPVTVLMFHGNGGNVSARLDGLLQMHRRLGVSILATEYRGYGLSEGIPSEDGTYRDALAARAWIDRRANGPIVYLGVSMGGAVAAWLATRNSPDALVIESAPSSLPAVARIHAPWVRILPTNRLMQTRYDTRRHVETVRCPLLVVHGDEDKEVPLESGRLIYTAAGGPKEFHMVSGGGHDRPDLIDEDEYYGVLGRFIERHARPKVAATGS